MSAHLFKTAGLIRAGFQYQDLVAIESIIDFYRDRSLYQWMEVECSNSSFQAIDDVVACRPDGQFELTQVKFTADPSRHLLDWPWLLAKKGRGKSLLEKMGYHDTSTCTRQVIGMREAENRPGP